MQVADMNDEEEKDVAKVKQQGAHYKKSGDYKKPQYQKKKKYDQDKSSGSNHSSKECTYCGKTGTHPPGRNCPAYGKQCNNCGGWNHYHTVCRKKNTSQIPQKKHIKKAEEEKEETSSDDDFFDKAINHLQVRRVKDRDILEKTVPIRIEDVDVRGEPDSGADVNIMDEHQFKALKNRSSTKLDLKPSKVKLSTLQSDLPVKGEVKVVVRNETCGTKARFVIIVKGRINSPPLISKKTLEELGMLKIEPKGLFAAENDLRIKVVSGAGEYSEICA